MLSRPHTLCDTFRGKAKLGSRCAHLCGAVSAASIGAPLFAGAWLFQPKNSFAVLIPALEVWAQVPLEQDLPPLLTQLSEGSLRVAIPETGAGRGLCLVAVAHQPFRKDT
ncbi:unnamed protein product [Caretta caretta]